MAAAVRALIVEAHPFSRLAKLRAEDGQSLVLTRHAAGFERISMREGSWLICELDLERHSVVAVQHWQNPPEGGFAGRLHFNCAQYKQVCETIALRVDTACDLLRQIQGALDGVSLSWEASTKLDAALIIAISIGAIADEATRPGGEVIGGHDHWNFGPDFGKLREEVRHA